MSIEEARARLAALLEVAYRETEEDYSNPDGLRCAETLRPEPPERD